VNLVAGTIQIATAPAGALSQTIEFCRPQLLATTDTLTKVDTLS
jgi:hypothetical protein